MSSAFKSCSCCRRACPKGKGFCPACIATGCAKKGYGAFNRGPKCPVKERCAGARTSRTRRTA